MRESDDARERVRHLMTIGRLDQARSLITELLASDPADGRSLRLLAEIELAGGDVERARALAQAAVSELPDAVSFLVLASVERQRRDFAAAVAACDRGLALEPDNPALHVTLSLAWAGPWLKEQPNSRTQEHLRAVEHAAGAASRALELDPDRPMAHYASAVANLVRNDVFAAAKALEPALELQPDWPEGHLLMSAIRGRQGMVKLASRHLATAGRLNPTSEEPLRQLRVLGGTRRLVRKKSLQTPWWLAPEARDILDADRRLGGL